MAGGNSKSWKTYREVMFQYELRSGSRPPLQSKIQFSRAEFVNGMKIPEPRILLTPA